MTAYQTGPLNNGRTLCAGCLLALAIFTLFTVLAYIGTAAADSTTSLPVNFEFSIDDLELAPTFRFRKIRVRCKMLAVTNNRAACADATLAIKESPFGYIKLRGNIGWLPDAGGLVLKVKGDTASAKNLAIEFAQRVNGSRIVVNFDALELQQVRDVLRSFGPFFAEHEVASGTFTLRATCDFETGEKYACATRGTVSGLNLNGVNVAENLTADYEIETLVDASGATSTYNATLRDGAIYFEPGFTLGSVNPGFFVSLAEAPIKLATQIHRSVDGRARILAFDLVHPDVVDVHFDGDLTFDDAPRWQALTFSLDAHDVDKFYATYMQPIALDTAFSALETAGAVHVKILGRNDEIDNLDLRFDNVFIDDDELRFSLYGLDGEISLHAGTDIRQSHIGWVGGAVYKIEFGQGRIDWVSSGRGLKVASWQDVRIFDGEFRMDTLEIENFGLDKTRVALSGTLTPITLSALTSAFGWMPLAGKLSGTIPRLTYAANDLVMDGDLAVNVFDGKIVLSDLQIEQMFSTVPVLSANIDVDRLSLEELTRTFSFGNISGLLSGEISNLELQAWQPIGFDASFATPIGDETPHRISRQAVDNLGRLGAGTGGAVSQGWLAFIPSYSYGRLGIGCRLTEGHCLMSGVEDATDGNFFILTRGGLLPPWIDVKGSGRRIKWRTLVDGVKQISQGDFELDIGTGNSTRENSQVQPGESR